MPLDSRRFCWCCSCVRPDSSDEVARSRLMRQTPPSGSQSATRPRIGAGTSSLTGALVLLALLAFYPAAFPSFITLGVTIVLFAAMATAWDVLGGWTGQLSLGHAVFVGIGAYAMGLLVPTNTDRKSTRLNSSHDQISYAVFCLKKKNTYLTR